MKSTLRSAAIRVLAASAGIAATAGALAAGVPGVGSSVDKLASVSTPLVKPAVPDRGAYLGAYVNPASVTTTSELVQIPAFQTSVHHNMGIYAYYTSFVNPPAPQVLSTIKADGAIPFISWHCYNVTAVASGAEDAIITFYANSLKAYGGPVLMRWYWEMNNPFSEAAINAGCGGYTNPAGYIAAWQHIYNLFQKAGATNVAFVWNPTAKKVATAWYPGSQYVDWIGGDGYDRTNTGAAAIGTYFGTFYSTFAPLGKPLLVGETGAPASDQTAYLGGLASQLPTTYPRIKGVVYWDSSSGGNWILSGSGLTTFASLASNPYFKA